MIFVTSWDDGHPLDERVADLLDRFGHKATFFVPIHNREGRAVLSTPALRNLDRQFEIGSHTLDHAPLTELSSAECTRQIVVGKEILEQQLGHPVLGFCYPRGKFNKQVRESVIQAGCAYSRTIENLRLDCGVDRWSVPTTIQIFPHGRQILLRNFLRYRNYASRFNALNVALRTRSWLDFLARLLETAIDDTYVLHVWGHSWEIEEQNLWPQLEDLFSLIASMQPQRCTVHELIMQGKGFQDNS